MGKMNSTDVKRSDSLHSRNWATAAKWYIVCLDMDWNGARMDFNYLYGERVIIIFLKKKKKKVTSIEVKNTKLERRVRVKTKSVQTRADT